MKRFSLASLLLLVPPFSNVVHQQVQGFPLLPNVAKQPLHIQPSVHLVHSSIQNSNYYAYTTPIPTLITSYSTASNNNDNEAEQQQPSDDDHHDAIMSRKVKGRKKRVIAGYKITAISYLLISLMITAKSRIPYYGTGPLSMATCAYILTDAAKHDRLSSDTYKRLNIALAFSALVSSLGNLFMGSTSFPLERFIAFIAIVNSVKGYGYGLKGWELKKASCAKSDLINGIKSNFATMTSFQNVTTSIGYFITTVILCALSVMKLTEILDLFLLQNSKNSKGLFFVGSRMYRFSKLMSLSIISFTLKDAADRNRLEGTTFIQLNYLLSYAFATLASKCIIIFMHTFLFSFYSFFHAMIKTLFDFTTVSLCSNVGNFNLFSGLIASCSIFTLANGIVSARKKMTKK